MELQRTEEWRIARAGCATASCFKDILATIKSGEAAARRNYRARLVCERLTGVPYANGFESAEMRFGTENEPLARSAYESETGAIVTESGFIKHPKVGWCGCSPDGLIGPDGLVEIKVPNTATHIETLTARDVPSEHIPQIQGQLWVTGRQWCDFVSFDPRLPPSLQLYIQRVPRDDKYIQKLEIEVIKFLLEVEAKQNELIALANKEAA